MNDFVFHFHSFELKTPYTIIFKGVCSYSTRPFKIEYMGTDIRNVGSANIPDEISEKLCDELKDDYGYGPFNQNLIESMLEKKTRYGFNFSRWQEWKIKL